MGGSMGLSGLAVGSLGCGRAEAALGLVCVVLVAGRRVVVERESGDDAANLHGLERLAVEQSLCESNHRVAVLLDDVARAAVLLADDVLDLLVYLYGRVFREVAVLRYLAAEEDLLLLLAEGERPQVRHAVLADHRARQLRRTLDVVGRARRDASKEDLFGEAAAHQDGDLAEQVIFRVVVAVALWQLLRAAEGHAARDYRHLVDGVSVRHLQADERVTRLVIRGDALLLVCDDHRAALRAHQNFVLRQLEVRHVDDLLVVARGVQGCLVDEVREVCAGETGRAARDDGDVNVLAQRNLARVDFEYAFAIANVRARDDDATVEAARAQERRVNPVGPVRRGHDDDAVVRLEAVHLDEQLIQRLLALVVPAAEPRAAGTADGINLINEDDAGGVLLPLLKQIAHARRADADEHLDEVGAGD